MRIFKWLKSGRRRRTWGRKAPQKGGNGDQREILAWNCGQTQAQYGTRLVEGADSQHCQIPFLLVSHHNVLKDVCQTRNMSFEMFVMSGTVLDRPCNVIM